MALVEVVSSLRRRGREEGRKREGRGKEEGRKRDPLV
jgi:hypothetical protein